MRQSKIRVTDVFWEKYLQIKYQIRELQICDSRIGVLEALHSKVWQEFPGIIIFHREEKYKYIIVLLELNPHLAKQFFGTAILNINTLWVHELIIVCKHWVVTWIPIRILIQLWITSLCWHSSVGWKYQQRTWCTKLNFGWCC